VAALPGARRPSAVRRSGPTHPARRARAAPRRGAVGPVVVLPWQCVLSLRHDLLTPTLDLYTGVARSGHHGRHAERPAGNDDGR
jgi:hypothetical protein